MTAPLYARVKDHVLSRIRSGALAPGARVPSENELVQHFSVSRMTANRALRELAADGYLQRVPGVGSFVRERQARASLIALRDIAEEIAARGHRHQARLLKAETVNAAGALAAHFGSGARLHHVILRHSENGMPVQLEDRHVNAEAVPDFLDQDFTAVTPTAWLLARLPADELDHTVSAALPTVGERRWLAMAEREACLRLSRLTWSGGVPITAATLTYPASRYVLHSRHRPAAG